ncbi:ABC transporter permease [Vibrio algarum]|uniref:Transport permease protein n=1 Tax=Vibrio algarum TaxID=3020714 RepID=A0ABT4YLP0_9VIBR|nr:ABC transporter permease [Vibrio sp. KJ40-1]MDB1122435.1 ABC transporter permease [Vibrio sp. KJ40-1]
MIFIKNTFKFLRDIYLSKNLVFTLAKNDFREQFLGSYLGLVWAVLKPSLFMAIVWFIFSIGFKGHAEEDGMPFILYLMCGYIPWFFFSDAVNGGMNSIVSNKYLVKKVNFRVSILPIVKITSIFFIHLIFLVILAIVFLFYGYFPTIYWLQLPFYISMMFFLVLGMSWFLSALRVFSKDISQIVSVILQLGFWVTPIFWSLSKVPEKYMYVLKFNPMIFIVEGYRNSFIYQKWFWESWEFTPSFLAILSLFFLLGAVIFRKLRPHFGDVI